MRAQVGLARFALLVASLGLVGLAFIADPAQAQEIRLPATRTVELSNGLRVVLAEQHALPLIEARLWLPAGAAAEPAGREGMAGFTAQLLTQGTATRSATEIANAIDQMGARLEANAGRDAINVNLTTLARHRKPALALLADCVLHSTFPDAEVERIRTRLLADLQQLAEDPESLADIALWRARFAQDPYGRRLQGTQSSLKAITAGELREYHRARLAPAGAVLVLVGDFDAAAAAKELKTLFGGWKGAPAPAAAPAAAAPGVHVVLVHKPELTQSQIRIGFPGLPRGHADEPALTVAAGILGGGYTSRLMDAIRVQRSLSYSASCRLVQQGRGGMLRVSTFTKTPTTRETVDVALDEIRRFREKGPGAEELARSASFLSGLLARSLQSPGDIADNLATVAFYHLPADYIARRIERLRAVTVDDVRRVTAVHFTAGDMSLVVVADSQAVRSGLEGLGAIEEVGFESLIE